MKKLVLFLFLSVSSLSLTSFGVVDNPKKVVAYQNKQKGLIVDTKSSQNAIVFTSKNEVNSTQSDDNSDESRIKRFFKTVLAFATKLVWSIISK